MDENNKLTPTRAKTDFWAKITYGIRTPMTAILGLAELGLRENMPSTVREYTETIQKAGKKLMLAFNDIVDFKKLEDGEMKIFAEEYALDALVASVINTVKEENFNAEFTVFVDRTLPNALIGDEARLKQVMEILLSNAVKFTKNGFIALSIEGKIINGIAKLEIKVEDTGKGIKEEDIPHVFDEFMQFDERVPEGSGLGLAIAKGLVSLMGGKIKVSSKYGRGCLFTVNISQKVSGYGSPVCEILNLEDKYVLVLEQRKHNIASIVRTLNNLGVANDVVSSASEFYDALDNGVYSHVLAASEMFGVFKRTYPNIPTSAEIILFSKNPDLTDDDGLVLAKPLFCVPVAEVLNGTHAESRRSFVSESGEKTSADFIAPAARILVVDDISANLTVAEGFLAPYRVQVDRCESGAAAIEAVRKTRYDLILMDHLMPTMTGAEAAIKIRSQNLDTETDCRHVPIIALTANTENASKRIFRRSGIDDFLAKPIDEDMLNIILEKYLPKEKQSPQPEKYFVRESAGEPALKIAGLNVQKGIAKVGGNPDVFLQVLKNFHESGCRLSVDLKHCADDGDMKNYHIHAHALTSLSKTIGADYFAGDVAALEVASEKNDLDFVRENTPEFLRNFAVLLDNIYEATSLFVHESPIAPSRKKILIIDDASSYLLILNDMLRTDYETLTSLSAEDGIETARRTKPDLILLDLIMPVMGGYDALKILKSDPELMHIPVILISGKEPGQNEKKGRELGAAGYIKKPFEISAVREIVRAWLRV